MKAQFLKIAGVKSEAEFYKKFPSEEAFMKKHGKEFKKAQNGLSTDANKNGIPDYLEAIQPNKNNYTGKGNIGQQFGSAINNSNFGPQNDPNYVRNIFTKPEPNTEHYDPSLESGLQYNPYQPTQKELISQNEQIVGGNALDPQKKNIFDWDKVSPYLNAGVNVIGGIQNWEAEKKAAQRTEQARRTSDVALKASLTRSEKPQRKYVRPEDYITSGNELYPVQGVGTNVLAKDGIDLTNRTYGPGEIQNTYAPEDLYADLGYEPLNDSNKLKSFQAGGGITPPSNFSSFMTGGGGTALASLAGAASGNNAGSQIGGGLGTAAGMAIGGPLGAQVGNFLGTAIGGAIDPNARKQKREQEMLMRNMNKMGIQQGTASIQANNASYMEDGGYVSNDWTPQVISMFGDHSPKDVYDFAHEGMDSLRTGGNVRQNNMFQQDQYALGGELKTHWGGTAETMSHNPYLPGSGETVMFRGKSHEERSPNGETGIGASYGGNMFEAERNEPMVELEEGGVVDPMTGEVKKSGVVFGNLKIPNQFVDLLGDKSAKGKKFKNYVGVDLYKQEKKGTRLVEEGTALANKQDVTPLELNVAEAKIFGGNSILKTAADRKIDAAFFQNSLNEIAEENGFDADALAKGKVQQAKFGGSFPQAQKGKKITKEEIAAYKAKGYKQDPKNPNRYYLPGSSKEVVTKIPGSEAVIKKGTPGQKYVPNENAWWRSLTPAQKAAHNAKVHKMIATDPKYKGTPDEIIKAAIPESEKREMVATPGDEIYTDDVDTTPIPYKRNKFLDFAGQVLPYLRPTDQLDLEGQQLYPEMYAMATNRLEPVQAQGYQPQLRSPYDISFQDQLNLNQSDYRAAQRLVGNNPAALAQLNAQKYKANQNVLGEQFRANQAMKEKVYGDNTNILNDAKLKNLAIYDKQYERQAQALSNTKAVAQAAITSIADKYSKNKLENRTLGVMENMYNYRFDPMGRAVNMNAPWQANIPTVGAGKAGQRQVPVYKDGKLDSYQLETYDPNEETVETAVAKNGTKLTSISEKKRNGSIVKAFKNF